MGRQNWNSDHGSRRQFVPFSYRRPRAACDLKNCGRNFVSVTSYALVVSTHSTSLQDHMALTVPRQLQSFSLSHVTI